jgi:Family of unknown function (DUF6527)
MKTRTASTADRTRRYLIFWCPGCDEPHQIQVEGPDGPRWTWDGNREQPTTQPSIRVFLDGKTEGGGRECHSFLKAGRIEFCGDSWHHLKGQTVDLPDWPKPNWAGLDEEGGTK